MNNAVATPVQNTCRKVRPVRSVCRDIQTSQVFLLTTTDPYQVIAHCFAQAHVHDFRMLVKKLVSDAAAAGVYKGLKIIVWFYHFRFDYWHFLYI